MIDLDTFLISDTHIGHDNIVQFCNRPQNHEDIIVDNWNDTVSITDTILHLGDLVYKGDRTANAHILRSLPGIKYYIKGNHDKQTEQWYEKCGFERLGTLLGDYVETNIGENGELYTKRVKHHGFYQTINNKRILFSHYPDEWLLDWDINCHGHIHNSQHHRPKMAADKIYHNMSVEVIDYTPVRLSAIL